MELWQEQASSQQIPTSETLRFKKRKEFIYSLYLICISKYLNLNIFPSNLTDCYMYKGMIEVKPGREYDNSQQAVEESLSLKSGAELGQWVCRFTIVSCGPSLCKKNWKSNVINQKLLIIWTLLWITLHLDVRKSHKKWNFCNRNDLIEKLAVSIYFYPAKEKEWM